MEDSPAEKAMSGRRKRLRLAGLLIVLVLSFAYLIFNVSEWADTPMVKQLLLGRVMKRFRGKLTAQRTHADLKKQTAEGWNVEVREGEGRLIARTPYAKVRMNLLALFWWRIKIAHIELDRPEMHLWTDPDRVFIWRKFKLPPKPRRRFYTRAGLVEARNGKFTYDYYPEPRPVHLHLEGINGSAVFYEKTPHIEATIKRLYLRFPGFDHRFDDVSVRGIADKVFARVKHLEATFLGIPLEITGRIDSFKSKNPRMDFTLRASGSIGDLLRYFRYEKDPPGTFELEARVTERTKDYRVAGTFNSLWGVVEGQRYDNAQAVFTYRSVDKTIRLSQFSLRMYGARIAGKGSYEIGTGKFAGTGKIKLKNRTVSYLVEGFVDTASGAITFDTLDLWTPYARISSSGTWGTKTGRLDFRWRLTVSSLIRELPHWGVDGVSGVLSLSGDISGPVRNLRATASGRVRNLAWFHALLGSGSVSVRLSDEMLNARVSVATGETRFKGSTRLRLFRNGIIVNMSSVPLSFDVEASGVRLTPKVFGTDLSGVASGYIEGDGTGGNITGSGRFTLVDVKAWGQSIRSARADITLGSRGVSFENAVVALPDGNTGKGHLRLDWRLNYNLELYAGRVRLSSLDAVTKTGRPITGTARVNLAGKGNFRKPRISGRAIFSSLKYDTLDLEGAELEFDLDGSVVNVRGNQPWGITVSGSYNLTTGAFINFEMGFDQADILPLCVWRCLVDTSGEFSGFLTLNGGEDGWNDVDYRLFITELDIKYREEHIRNLLPIRVEIGPSGGIEEIHLFTDSGTLHITGDLSPEAVWNLDVLADLDLSTVPNLISTFSRASGRMLINARVAGPSDDLAYWGGVTVQEGSMRIRGYRAEFSELDMMIEFMPGNIGIKEFKGKVGDGGSFNIAGKLLTRGTEIEALDLALEAYRIPLQSSGTYKALVSPILTLRGPPDQLSLKGKVLVYEGRYTRDVRIEKRFIEVKRETAPRRKLPNWIKNLRMSIHIIDEGRFLIKNNLAEVPLQMDVIVGGTPVEPIIEGKIEGLGGKIFYGGREFELVRGRLDFANPIEIDPLVDVFARLDVRDYEVRLYLKGVLSHMELRLESSPNLDDQNILALIMFNKTADELSEGEYQALANIPLFFAQDFSRAVGMPLESFTGIDIFTVEAREDSPGARVTVGKKLSKRIEVEYSSDMGGEFPLQETRLIYKLTDNLWLQGSQNSEGLYSFRLNFHFVIK